MSYLDYLIFYPAAQREVDYFSTICSIKFYNGYGYKR